MEIIDGQELQAEIDDLTDKKRQLLKLADKLVTEGAHLENEASILMAESDDLYTRADELEGEADDIQDQIDALEETLETMENNPDFIHPKFLKQEETLFDDFD